MSAAPRLLPQQLTLDHVSPATRLLEKRRQTYEVQEALDAQKEEFRRREAEFKRREDKLKERDLALQESLIRFNKFLQENDSKRSRAEKKERDEIKQRVAKEAEIERLIAQLERLTADRAEMLIVLGKDMRYQQFLEAVVEAADEYPEVSELLLRYETLEATHRDLVERSREGQEETSEQAAFNKRFHKEKLDEILEHNNQIALLQQRFETALAHTKRLQAETDRAQHDSADATLQLGQVLMASDNIFTRCANTSVVARRKFAEGTEDTEVAMEQLSVIRDHLGDLLHIAKTCKPGEARTAAAVAPAAAPQPPAATSSGGGARARHGGGAPGAGSGSPSHSNYGSPERSGRTGKGSSGNSGRAAAAAPGATRLGVPVLVCSNSSSSVVLGGDTGSASTAGVA